MRASVKAFTVRLGSSLLVIAVLAPVLALSMIAGGRAGAVMQSNGNEWLLIALAFGGAAASAVNGLGRSIRRSRRIVHRCDSHVSEVQFR
jgi:uncharacterized membrane protein